MSTTIEREKIGQKDNVYINIVIPGSSDNVSNIPATYNQTFNQAILADPSQYYCSVIRFALPLDTIPIQHFPVDTSQNNPNVTICTVYIKDAGYNTQAFGTLTSQQVIWQPENSLTAPTPQGSAPFFTPNQTGSDYYNNFSIQNVVNMFNVAIQAAVTAAGLAVTAPYYSWNPATNLFSLTISAGFAASGHSLGVNTAAQNYFDSFNVWEDIQNHIFWYNTTLPSGASFPYTFSEDYTSIDLWFDVRRIIIQSNGLPILNESIPVQNATTGQVSGVVVFSPILTDYILPLSNPEDLKSVAVYVPTSQYRLVDMQSNAPLVKIDLTFFWQDKNGNQFPVNISPRQQSSVKIAFLNKHLYARGK